MQKRCGRGSASWPGNLSWGGVEGAAVGRAVSRRQRAQWEGAGRAAAAAPRYCSCDHSCCRGAGGFLGVGNRLHTSVSTGSVMKEITSAEVGGRWSGRWGGRWGLF